MEATATTAWSRGGRRSGGGRDGGDGGGRGDGGVEVERAWLPPCVVLVINDNLYGLMFALS